ncbi:MAG: DUF6470 family protein [Oscillospiraceae bacterium]|nr:DUF6470 family protein [Oscillospiraceae bacterium]
MTRIQIYQTPGAIRIETQPAQLRVHQSKRLALNIRQNRAALRVNSRPARLNIDQSACFASSGLKSPLNVASDFYSNAMRSGFDAISSIVREGLRFLRIEQGGNAVAEIAQTRGVKTRPLVMRAMPSVRPQISVEPGQLNMEWTPHSVDTSWEVIEGQSEFIPQQISVVMDPYPSIDINVLEEERITPPEDEKKKFQL